MNKDTIEFSRNTNHLSGCGQLEEPLTNDPAVLDAIVQWSQGKNTSIYRHLIRREEEHLRPQDIHLYEGRKYVRCDLVHYIDIYHQPSQLPERQTLVPYVFFWQNTKCQTCGKVNEKAEGSEAGWKLYHPPGGGSVTYTCPNCPALPGAQEGFETHLH